MAVFIGQTDGHISFLLFMAQCNERINPARSSCGNETRHQGDASEQYRQCSKGNRVRRLDLEKHRLQESRQHHRSNQPCSYTSYDDKRDFAQDESQNVAALRAQRHAESDFAGALA